MKQVTCLCATIQNNVAVCVFLRRASALEIQGRRRVSGRHKQLHTLLPCTASCKTQESLQPLAQHDPRAIQWHISSQGSRCSLLSKHTNARRAGLAAEQEGVHRDLRYVLAGAGGLSKHVKDCQREKGWVENRFAPAGICRHPSVDHSPSRCGPYAKSALKDPNMRSC